MNNLDSLLCGCGVPNCGPPPVVVKLRQGSGKDQQGMAVKAKGLKA